MDRSDRKFYVVWGLALVLIAIAAALWLEGQGAIAWLVLFGGIGVSLVMVSEGDNLKFYGGIGFILAGVLMFSALSGLNIAITLIALVAVVGGLVIWHGFRGGEK